MAFGCGVDCYLKTNNTLYGLAIAFVRKSMKILDANIDFSTSLNLINVAGLISKANLIDPPCRHLTTSKKCVLIVYQSVHGYPGSKNTLCIVETWKSVSRFYFRIWNSWAWCEAEHIFYCSRYTDALLKSWHSDSVLVKLCWADVIDFFIWTNTWTNSRRLNGY